MNVKVFLFLIIATTLETFGDAIVRIGIGQTTWLPRGALFAAGAFLLFGYGLSLNLAPIEFNRVVGLYITTLFIVWQIVNLIVFRSPPATMAVADKATYLGPHGPLIDGRKAQCCNSFHNQRNIAVEHWGRKNIQRRSARCLCLIDSRYNLLSIW